VGPRTGLDALVTNRKSYAQIWNRITAFQPRKQSLSDVKQSSRSPRWVAGNIGSTDATKTCHTLNAYIFETNNRKVINNTSLDGL
jgi:hypothetical protein